MKNLIFLDTNIYLDFYRIENEARKGFLAHIQKINNSVIMTYQIDMEFKKNRQSVIVKTIKDLKHPSSISRPGLLSEDRSYAALANCIKKSKSHIAKLKTRLKRVLEDPIRNDPVYNVVQQLAKKKNEIVLRRGTEAARSIRELAQKRWVLGYPPRKDNDTSIGDAVNWEWLIYVVSEEKPENLFLVSRDSDYGITFEESSYLNDWLFEEFKKRVGRKTNVRLYSRLSEVLKELKFPVSRAEELAERYVSHDDFSDNSEGMCLRCGATALLDLRCNKCGQYVLADEDGVNFSFDENGKFTALYDGEHEQKMVCDCGSDDLEIEWHKLCSWCDHMMSKND